jgi:hypothetical protein
MFGIIWAIGYIFSIPFLKYNKRDGKIVGEEIDEKDE